MSGQQAVNIFKKGLRRHNILERQIIVQRLGIELLVIIRMLQDAFDLGSVDQFAFCDGVVHGLDAEKVSCDKYGMILCVIDRKAEHPSQTVQQFFQQFFAPFFKAVDQHLRVRFGRKGVPESLKLTSQLPIVIDLSVKGQHHRFVLVKDWLMSLVKVNDA